MNADDQHDAKIDALYQIAVEIKEARNDMVRELKNINAHLEDISAGVAGRSTRRCPTR